MGSWTIRDPQIEVGGRDLVLALHEVQMDVILAWPIEEHRDARVAGVDRRARLVHEAVAEVVAELDARVERAVREPGAQLRVLGREVDPRVERSPRDRRRSRGQRPREPRALAADYLRRGRGVDDARIDDAATDVARTRVGDARPDGHARMLRRKHRVEKQADRNRRVYLVSGLLRCGTCGGPMTIAGSKVKAGVRYVSFGCTAHASRGPAICANGSTISERKITD
jgi:Recombinase zinc beta ribbon domain